MESANQNNAYVIEQENNGFDVFRGLSDQCPRVFEKAVKEVLNFLEQTYFVVAVMVLGWNGVGKERIVKYVAKQAMESKLFDVLIWAMELQQDRSEKKFQLCVAEQLGIAFPSNDNSEDDEDVCTLDDIIGSRIRACLEEKKFLFVHGGDWELKELERMGIPVTTSKKYSKVLNASTNKVRKYHEFVSIEKPTEEERWDILQEECVDIANNPKLQRIHITPDVVMQCIRHAYFRVLLNNSFYFLVAKSTSYNVVKHWIAMGFIGGEATDMKTAFHFGEVLLSELSDRGIMFRQGPALRLHDEIIRRMGQQDDSCPLLLVKPPSNYKVLTIENVSPSLCSKIKFIFFANLRNNTKIPENFFQHMTEVRNLDWNSNIISVPSSIICLVNLRSLSLSRCSGLEEVELSFLKYLEKLEVLELSKTNLEGFPDNIFEGVQRLRLLDLSECSKLLSLPSSVSCLINLELFDLRDCRNLSVVPSSVLPLGKLQVLDLSGTKLVKLPELFFQCMYKLKFLNLSSNSCMTSLPTSISNLERLEELNLSNCPFLYDINHATFSLPNLQSLNLLHTPFMHKQLSFRNCSSLETIIFSHNKYLEMLDLSGTKIKEFPNIYRLDQSNLKRLDLLDTKNLRKVDWKQMDGLPQEVNWDQCGDGSTPPHVHIQLAEWRKDGNRDGVFMSVGNASIFRTLEPSSKLWEKALSCFLVYTCPCKERGKGKTPLQKRLRLRYEDIFSNIKLCIPNYERCLEIEKVYKLPEGISGVLSHAQFFTLHDEAAIIRLSDLGMKNMQELKECWIQRCHAMKVVFSIVNNDLDENLPVLRCLEKLRISNLMKLTNMLVSNQKLATGSFCQLKHLFLEHCPRLVNVFSHTVYFKSLEVLEFKFCARLEEIISGKHKEEGSLQRLQTLCLVELPALKSIAHDEWLVSLNKAQVKGCPRLRKLPLCSNNIKDCRLERVNTIEVTGELEWWKQLEWKDNNVKQQISFKCWRPLQYPPRRS